MADLVVSSGISDSQAYLQAVANVKAPFSVPKNSGQYPLIGNILVNRRLANMWQAIHLASRIFVDGMGVTSVTAEAEDAAYIRIPQLFMPARRKRTLGTQLCPNGEMDGTPGNNEPFNKNLPSGMQTDAVDLKLVQEYDEAAQIASVNMRLFGNNLDLLGQYTSRIPELTAMLLDCDILATQVASALARANQINKGNIIPYDPDNSEKGYMQRIMNTLATALSNVQGSYKEGIISYPKEKSVFVLRFSVFNKLMTIDNGAIINSDIGQKMLLDGVLSADGQRLLGASVMGKYYGIYIKVVPDELWDTAAGELNLTVAQKAQWDKVVGYIASGYGTYVGRNSIVTQVSESPTTSIGFIVRNDWGWGVKVTRPSSIALLVETADNLNDFVNPITTFNDINSPNDLEALIQSYQNANAMPDGSLERIGIATATTVTDFTLTLTAATGGAAIANATLSVADGDGLRHSFGNNGDGTYTFTLNRGSAAIVTITAPGYANTTVEVTAADTALATKTLTATMSSAAPAKSK